MMTKAVLRFMSDRVRGLKVKRPVNLDAGLGVELVSDPPELQGVVADDARGVVQGNFCFIDQSRIDSVEQPSEDLGCGGTA
nr:hypothetical protein [Aeromicrobium sp. A1-2]